MKQILGCELWADATASELRRVADRIAAAPPPEHLGEIRLCFAKLAEKDSTAIVELTHDDKIDRDRCLYVISLDDKASSKAFVKAYEEAKNRRDLRLPQNNDHESNILYVGSSCATQNRRHTLRNRLRQHLFGKSMHTYALSLACWATKLQGGIIINAWQFTAINVAEGGDHAARTVVLAVGDWLSGQLKPMLGRRGSRH